MTRHYLSNTTHQLVMSVVQRLVDEQGQNDDDLVINFNLRCLFSYLNGDKLCSYCHHYFQ